MEYTDILYEKSGGIATITINRPEVRNAFRPLTVDEMIGAFQDAWEDDAVGVVILTGAGDKAFSSGGDQKIRGKDGYQDDTGHTKLRITELHAVMRMIPKPVIAAVNGFAIGGGHVLHVICDLSLASENAIFGQTGPRVGSFDAGFGTGVPRASRRREEGAGDLVPVPSVLGAGSAGHGPREQGGASGAADAGGASVGGSDAGDEPDGAALPESVVQSGHGLAYGLQQMAHGAVQMYYNTEEAQEGARAFNEKRPPDFSPVPETVVVMVRIRPVTSSTTTRE